MTVQNIVFEASKNDAKSNIEVKISLSDKCRNGHEDFSITATTWAVGKPRTDRHVECGGRCQELILERFPQYRQFVDLHLSDCTGAPMHALANGFYHLKDKETAIRHLRLKGDEYDQVCIAEDKEHLSFLLESLGIIDRWKAEAQAAIAELERMTGKKFESKATRSQYTPLTDDQKDKLQKRLESGFYSSEQLQKRADEKAAKHKQKLIDELASKRDKAISKLNLLHSVDLALVEHFGRKVNFIYYDHRNELCFNWVDYENILSEESIQQFIDSNPDLPDGIAFKNKIKGRTEKIS